MQTDFACSRVGSLIFVWCQQFVLSSVCFLLNSLNLATSATVQLALLTLSCRVPGYLYIIV